jgi:hypothetical protein
MPRIKTRARRPAERRRPRAANAAPARATRRPTVFRSAPGGPVSSFVALASRRLFFYYRSSLLKGFRPVRASQFANKGRILGGRSFGSDITKIARSAFLCAASPAACTLRPIPWRGRGLCAASPAEALAELWRAARTRPRVFIAHHDISNRNIARLELKLTPANSSSAPSLTATKPNIAIPLSFVFLGAGNQSGSCKPSTVAQAPALASGQFAAEVVNNSN